MQPSASRRTFLRGAGVTMALPWLESIPVWGARRDRRRAPAPCPKRFAALFMGNGVNPTNWWAKGAGADDGAEQEPRAAGAAEGQDRTSSPACSTSTRRASASIPGQTGNILSGAALQKGAELQGGHQHRPGARQRTWARRPSQPSMVLGCEQPITGYHETNFSMAYSSHISWQSATSPVPMEVYPSLAFDSLFDNQGSKRNQSILDRVRERGRRPEPPGQPRRPGQARRVPHQRPRGRETGRARCARRSRQADDRAQRPRPPRRHDAPARQRPARGHPRAHAADVRHHRPRLPDRQDARSPRCCSAATSRGCSTRSSTSATPHHPASHDDQSDAYERVTRYYVSQLAYLASPPRRDARGRRARCSTTRACCSSRACGRAAKHDSSKVPVLLAGGLGGTLATGRVLDYTEQGRRQPQAVQPVPVDHGPDGREARRASATPTPGSRGSDSPVLVARSARPGSDRNGRAGGRSPHPARIRPARRQARRLRAGRAPGRVGRIRTRTGRVAVWKLDLGRSPQPAR